jgi:hypothetical protein
MLRRSWAWAGERRSRIKIRITSRRGQREEAAGGVFMEASE